MTTKTKTPAKPRKPEEVWYDVHKHPAGVPGGMGKSPEYHLRGRGWSGHEINESAGRKTIQYRNHQYPDFVISYGGGTSQKPDHNFRVLYMGTNRNVPKVHHTFSVAEAMNKVEELHKLQTGLVVQPLTAVQAATAPAAKTTTPTPSNPAKRRDMNDDPNDPPIGPPKVDFPTQPDKASDWPKQKPQVQEIKPPAKPKPTPVPKPAPVTTVKHQQTLKYAAHGTLTGRNRHKKASEDLCPLCRKASAIYSRDPNLYRALVLDSGGLTGEHLWVTSEFHDRVQEALIPRGEYQRQRRQARDADVARAAGMDIQPWEVADYRGLRKVIASLRVRDDWETPLEKVALGDLTYGPEHPRAGEPMSDDDAHEYLLGYQPQKQPPNGISHGEHREVMARLPEMEPSSQLEYSLFDPAVGFGANKRIWLRADHESGDLWHHGRDDEEGNVVDRSDHPISLDNALNAVSEHARDWGWL